MGIDFKTSMLPPQRVSFGNRGYYDDSSSRNMNVRTDSYFTEPGFMSIFAHGCAGPQQPARGNRINSKKPYLDDPLPPPLATPNNYIPEDHRYHVRPNRHSHQRRFWYPIKENLEHRMDTGIEERKLADAESMEFEDVPRNEWHQVESNDPHQSEEIASAFLRELESLFSKGAQGILTSYIQTMLQPAIKNTLMEGMGYRISYG